MFANFITETCTGTSGDVTLTGVTNNHIAFNNAYSNGDQVAYVIEDADGIKKCSGVGVYNTGGTITRSDSWFWDGTSYITAPNSNLILTNGTHTIRVAANSSQIEKIVSGEFLSTTSTANQNVAGTVNFIGSVTARALHVTNDEGYALVAGASGQEFEAGTDGCNIGWTGFQPIFEFNVLTGANLRKETYISNNASTTNQLAVLVVGDYGTSNNINYKSFVATNDNGEEIFGIDRSGNTSIGNSAAGWSTIAAGNATITGFISATGKITSNGINIGSVAVPATANSAGTLGEIRYDATYLYACVATDVWKRVALSTW